MVKLARAFSQLQPFKALVLGDFMLDRYTTGIVRRISPEAPVPVMQVVKQESRPGGAGNVVLNLIALGASVAAVGRIGPDPEGEELKKHLSAADRGYLFMDPDYKTPVKNRLIADSQQLMRIDWETLSPLNLDLEEMLIKRLKELIFQVDVVALSDYGKGFLTHRLIQTAIHLAKEAGIPSIVDPKGSDFRKYKGATVLKPNLSEAYAAAKCASSAPLEDAAIQLSPLAEILLITRSEAGISVFHSNGGRSDFPVRSKEVKDVTGAGDTVLSTICLGLANGLDIELTAQLANLAAGLAIERLGCAQITLSELAERLLEIDSDTKIFDESHTYALHQVLQGKKYTVLVLKQGQAMTGSLFRTIREFSRREGEELIVCVKGAGPEDDFIHLLSCLPEVDYIILQAESLRNLCSAIQPHAVFLFHNDQPVPVGPAQDLLQSLIYQFA